jgi:hypothetical protein
MKDAEPIQHCADRIDVVFQTVGGLGLDDEQRSLWL